MSSRMLEISCCDSCWKFDSMECKCSVTGKIIHDRCEGSFDIPESCPLPLVKTQIQKIMKY
jgi:hypothetical protein